MLEATFLRLKGVGETPPKFPGNSNHASSISASLDYHKN